MEWAGSTPGSGLSTAAGPVRSSLLSLGHHHYDDADGDEHGGQGSQIEVEHGRPVHGLYAQV